MSGSSSWYKDDSLWVGKSSLLQDVYWEWYLFSKQVSLCEAYDNHWNLGLYKLDNDRLLRISKVPDTIYWSFLAGLASVAVTELLKLSL